MATVDGVFARFDKPKVWPTPLVYILKGLLIAMEERLIVSPKRRVKMLYVRSVILCVMYIWWSDVLLCRGGQS